MTLADANLSLASEIGRERRLRLAMRGVDDTYDLVIIDTSPATHPDQHQRVELRSRGVVSGRSWHLLARGYRQAAGRVSPRSFGTWTTPS